MFRPSFENLEKREVFSVSQPLGTAAGSSNVYVEEVSPGFVSHTRPANDGILEARDDGTYSLAIGPNVAGILAAGTFGRGLTADFDGDSDVDGADFLAACDPASGQFTGPKQTVETGVDVTSIGLKALAGASFVDDLIGWDFRSRTIDHDETTLVAADIHDAAFANLGRSGILLDPEARGNIVDGTSNTIMFARAAGSRACVTDLVIDPFNSNRLIGTDGGVWRARM